MVQNSRYLEPPALDVQRTDVTGDVDLAQIEHNLTLAPGERLERHDRFGEFALMVRRAGAKLRDGGDFTPPPAGS